MLRAELKKEAKDKALLAKTSGDENDVIKNEKITKQSEDKELDKSCTMLTDCENTPKFAQLLVEVGKQLKKLYKWEARQQRSLTLEKTAIEKLVEDGVCADMCYDAPNPVKGLNVSLFNSLINACHIGNDYKSYLNLRTKVYSKTHNCGHLATQNNSIS